MVGQPPKGMSPNGSALPTTLPDYAGKAGKAGAFLGFDDVATDGVAWLRPDCLARGKVTLLAGAGGLSKGTLGAHLMTCVTNNKPWAGRVGI